MNKKIVLTMLYFFLIGIYLEIPFKLSNLTYIPGVTILVQMPFVYYYIKSTLKKDDFFFFYKITLLVIVSVPLARGLEGFDGMLFKLIQFPVSILIGIALFKFCTLIDFNDLKQVYYNLTLLLFIGSLLEYFKIIDGISIEVSKIIYTGTNYTPYDSLDRDIQMIGWGRPRFFTSEPSLLSIGYFVFSSIYVLLNDKYNKFIQIIVLDIIFIGISGSPIAIINLFNSIFIKYYSFNGKTKAYLIITVIGISTLILFTPFFQSSYDKYYNRLSSETFENGSSLYARLYFPYIKGLPQALSYNPLFGVGYGGKELMFKLSKTGYSLKSGFSMDYIDGANAFARIFMYLGIIGGIYLFFLIIKYYKKNVKDSVIPFVIFWILFGQTLGTFETPRFWGYTFMIFSAFVIKNNYLKNKP